jgi:hypothetical protein
MRKVHWFLSINKFSRDDGYRLNLEDDYPHGQAEEEAPQIVHPTEPAPE